jgi:hypothetical protein
MNGWIFLLTSSVMGQTSPDSAAQNALAPMGHDTMLQAATPPAAPPPLSQTPLVQMVPLRLMLEKGIVTQAEYDAAIHDMKESVGSDRAAADITNIVIGKWSTTIYGFAEGDYIYDSRQGFIDIPGAPLVARSGTYAANHPQLQFSGRNSRIGFRFRAPEYNGIRMSAQFEGDFNVTVPGGSALGVTQPSQPYQLSENNLYTNPFFRTRHFYLKAENPIVDVLAGQTWHVFGWQSEYMPNTVQPQGIPGEIYSRTMQLRLSKSLKSDLMNLDIAAAVMRPPQRASAVPEGEAGIHLTFNKWKAAQTISSTGSTVSPLSLAVTGDVRRFTVPNFAASPTASQNLTTTAAAVDAFVPLVPATAEDRANSLSVMGEAVWGSGIVDMYTGLASGVSWPTLPASPTGAAQTFNPLMDPGYVTFDKNGNLQAIKWVTYRIGAQYYLPAVDGKIWVSANYSYVKSPNAQNFYFVKAPGTLDHLEWFDVNLMGDVTPALRLGIEYANYSTSYADGVVANDHRVYASAFFIF